MIFRQESGNFSQKGDAIEIASPLFWAGKSFPRGLTPPCAEKFSDLDFLLLSFSGGNGRLYPGPNGLNAWKAKPQPSVVYSGCFCSHATA